MKNLSDFEKFCVELISFKNDLINLRTLKFEIKKTKHVKIHVENYNYLYVDGSNPLLIRIIDEKIEEMKQKIMDHMENWNTIKDVLYEVLEQDTIDLERYAISNNTKTKLPGLPRLP